MRVFVLSVILLVIGAMGAQVGHAQTANVPAERNAVDGTVIARSFTKVSIPAPASALAPAIDTGFLGKSGGSDIEIIDEVIWSSIHAGTDSAFTQAYIVTESIQFVGHCDSADQVSTPDIFQAVAETAVAQGVARGYIPCLAGGSRARVVTPACVVRSGSNCATTFRSCDSLNVAFHDYNVLCTSGGANITPGYSFSPACGGGNGCQATGW